MPLHPAEPEYGPITRAQANRRRIRYGPLTPNQFDDLERLEILGSASVADLVSGVRAWDSVARSMMRHMERGWVVRVDSAECWRLTRHGLRVLGFAFEHMDTMIGDSDE